MIYTRQAYTREPIFENQDKRTGDFKTFVLQLNRYFTHFYLIKIKDELCEEALTLEKTIFLSIIQKLNQRGTNIKHLQQMLQSQRQGIMKSSGLSLEAIQQVQKSIIQYYDNILLSNRKADAPNLITYITNFLRNICDKKEKKQLFGKKVIKYERADFQKLKKITKIDIHLLDYEDSKKQVTAQFKKPYIEDAYVMKARKNYYILLSGGNKALKKDNDLDQIKIIKNSKIAAKDIEKLFQKDDSQPSSKNQSSLFPQQVSCYICNKYFSEFDCLYWNYSYICAECLANPTNDTSNIPPPIIQKYCRQRNINYTHYDIICPQCQAVTSLNNYNPAQKPKKFKCTMCTKIICVDHCCNIFGCFCFCPKCREPTFYIDKLDINYCQICKRRFCFKCKTQSKKFCKCVCKQCLGEDNEKHICVKKCHQCLNATTKLKECRCGMYSCYGCYYNNLQKKPFECSFVEFE